MRFGQNPAKMGLPAHQPARLGISLLSYIPDQEGYFSQAMEIIKYQIASLHRSTQNFDLLVFDNHSCPQVQDELKRLLDKGLIHHLVLSKFNLGKTGAMNWMLTSMPNELICCADSDVLFRPGWFEQSLAVLECFPDVGFVTAQPCMFDALKGSGNAHSRLENDNGFHISLVEVPADMEVEYLRGVDNGSAEIRAHLLKQWEVIRHADSGQEAIIGASHMQFLSRSDVIRRVLPLPANFALSREDDRQFNLRVDEQNLLQLSTCAFYVSHMGNRLDAGTLDEIHALGLDEILQQPARQPSMLAEAVPDPAKQRLFRTFAWLSRMRTFRDLLRRVYRFLFEFFAGDK
jgi:hypothetical protein